MDLPSVVTQVSLTLMASAFGAWIGARIAFARYRMEKVWERKESAYREVIEALDATDEWVRSELSASRHQVDLPEEETKKLATLAKSSNARIRKAINSGAFLLRADAVERLQEYWNTCRQFDQQREGYDAYLAMDEKEARACLKQMVKIPRDDLGIR